MNKENRPAADLFPEDAEDPGGPPVSSGSPATWSYQFFSQFGEHASMGAHASGDEDVECARVFIDNSKMRGGRVGMQSHVVQAGAPTSALVTRYSINNGGTFADLASVPMAVASSSVPRVGSLVTVPDDAAVSNLLLKLVRRGGNGTLAPRVWNAIISAVSGRPTTIGEGDLPTGDWGNVIHDLNAKTILDGSLYSEGQEVALWPDDGPSGLDGVAATGSPPGPVFRAGGLPGGKPCVQWPGGNTTPIVHGNPTQHHFTLYQVAANLSAGYAFTMYNGYDGYPFGKLLQIIGGVLGNGFAISVNDSVGSPTIIFETRTIAQLLELHLYRFVFNRFTGHFWFYIDGILVADGACSPQITNTTNILIGQYNTLAGTMDLGRSVTYDTPHVTPDMSSTTTSVDGLTEPELVLQAYWGTP